MELVLWIIAILGNLTAALGALALIIYAEGVKEDGEQERSILRRVSGH
jgi:hypothetical protein